MARTATVRLGEYEAVFDGERFTSADESTANVLNSALEGYHRGARAILGTEYWPDPFMNLARAVAEYCGGQLIAFDPPTGEDVPEGALF